MARSHSPNDDTKPPHHAKTFDDFSSAINLRAQGSPAPAHCASAIFFTNPAGDADPAVFTLTMADGGQITITVPPAGAFTLRGAFRSIDSCTGGTDPEATAFWHDVE